MENNYYNNENYNSHPPPMYAPPLKDIQMSQYNQSTSQFNMPNNFSISTSRNTNAKILQIDNRIVGFSQYIFFLWFLMIFSLFGTFSSMFVINSIELSEGTNNYYILHDQKIFEILNFFTNLTHVILYAFSIKAFTSQLLNANQKAEYMLAGLTASNFLFFLLYIFLYHVSFFTWCVDIFYFFINGILYFQCKELTELFEAKDKLKRFDALLI
jgi:hypothetical protein